MVLDLTRNGEDELNDFEFRISCALFHIPTGPPAAIGKRSSLSSKGSPEQKRYICLRPSLTEPTEESEGSPEETNAKETI
jgi:hypothetical protein